MTNTISVTVTDIQKYDALRLLQCQSKEQKLTIMSLELSDKVQTGSNIELGIKPTNIILAKEYPQKKPGKLKKKDLTFSPPTYHTSSNTPSASTPTHCASTA